MKKIGISAGPVAMEAELYDTVCAQKVWDALPIEARANTWGDEIYFGISVDADQEPDARPEVDVGELAYGPAGPYFCIFFGPTPVSTDDKPRAACPVNRIGRVCGDPAAFRTVPPGATVTIERADDA